MAITKGVFEEQLDMSLEHQKDSLRIQREESQYATRMQSKTANLSAYQIEKQAEVGVAGANALGQMGSNGAGDVSGGGFNPAQSATNCQGSRHITVLSTAAACSREIKLSATRCAIAQALRATTLRQEELNSSKLIQYPSPGASINERSSPPFLLKLTGLSVKRSLPRRNPIFLKCTSEYLAQSRLSSTSSGGIFSPLRQAAMQLPSPCWISRTSTPEPNAG